MAKKKIDREWVTKGQEVSFYKHLHEVKTEDGMRLIMTQKTPVGKKSVAPVIMVHGLGQNRFSWTLPSRSLENFLVSQGFTTFNVELRGHGLSRANGSQYPEAFESYLQYDLPALIREARDLSGGEKLFYFGHSLGGAISYCIGAQFQEHLRGIVSIAGPYTMAQGNPVLKTLGKLGSLAMKVVPVQKIHPEAFYIDYLGVLARHGLFALDHPLNLIPIQVWYPRSMERGVLTERIVLGFDRTSFSVFKLLIDWSASGKLHGTNVKDEYESHIHGLEIPILFVAGDRDYVVPPSSVKSAYLAAGSSDKELKVFGGETPGLHWGHCDLIFGREAPGITWPHMLEWMQKRV